jgi:hypothetical protein
MPCPIHSRLLPWLHEPGKSHLRLLAPLAHPASSRQCSPLMKKRTAILIGLVLALAGGALVVSLLPARPRVSMSLIEYRRWPHGAMLRLTNGTQATISYIAEPDGTPAGSPVLCLQKTSSGWTNTATTLSSVIALDGRTGKSMEVFFLSDSGAPPKPGQRIQTLTPRVLKPGQSVEFFVRLEPDAIPRKVGTICCLPPGKFAKTVQPWLARIKQWCRVKATPTHQVEVWCATPLQVSLSPSPAPRN